MGDGAGDVIRAVCLRLQNNDGYLPLSQSLIRVLAKILAGKDQLAMLTLLHGYTLPNGENALQMLMSLWTTLHEGFHGTYQINLSLYTLSKLFWEPGLDGLSVPGDEEVTASEARYSTRRKAKVQHAWEPVKLRIFKLLVRDFMVVVEDLSPEYEAGSDEDEPEDEYQFGEGELDDDGYGDFDTVLDELMDEGYDIEDQETDPDILSDPIYNMKAKVSRRHQLRTHTHRSLLNSLLSTLASKPLMVLTSTIPICNKAKKTPSRNTSSIKGANLQVKVGDQAGLVEQRLQVMYQFFHRMFSTHSLFLGPKEGVIHSVQQLTCRLCRSKPKLDLQGHVFAFVESFFDFHLQL